MVSSNRGQRGTRKTPALRYDIREDASWTAPKKKQAAFAIKSIITKAHLRMEQRDAGLSHIPFPVPSPLIVSSPPGWQVLLSVFCYPSSQRPVAAVFGCFMCKVRSRRGYQRRAIVSRALPIAAAGGTGASILTTRIAGHGLQSLAPSS